MQHGDCSAVTLHALADALIEEDHEAQAELFRVLARGVEQFPDLAEELLWAEGARDWMRDLRHVPRHRYRHCLTNYPQCGWITDGWVAYRPDERDWEFLSGLTVPERARRGGMTAFLTLPVIGPVEWQAVGVEKGVPSRFFVVTGGGTRVDARHVGFLARRFPPALWQEHRDRVVLSLIEGSEAVALVAALA
jgi:hypothetical protein